MRNVLMLFLVLILVMFMAQPIMAATQEALDLPVIAKAVPTTTVGIQEMASDTGSVLMLPGGAEFRQSLNTILYNDIGRSVAPAPTYHVGKTSGLSHIIG